MRISGKKEGLPRLNRKERGAYCRSTKSRGYGGANNLNGVFVRFQETEQVRDHGIDDGVDEERHHDGHSGRRSGHAAERVADKDLAGINQQVQRRLQAPCSIDNDEHGAQQQSKHEGSA